MAVMIVTPRITLDPARLPCCPYCDNAIEASMDAGVGNQDGTLFLAHWECLNETGDDAEDEG